MRTQFNRSQSLLLIALSSHLVCINLIAPNGESIIWTGVFAAVGMIFGVVVFFDKDHIRTYFTGLINWTTSYMNSRPFAQWMATACILLLSGAECLFLTGLYVKSRYYDLLPSPTPIGLASTTSASFESAIQAFIYLPERPEAQLYLLREIENSRDDTDRMRSLVTPALAKIESTASHTNLWARLYCIPPYDKKDGVISFIVRVLQYGDKNTNCTTYCQRALTLLETLYKEPDVLPEIKARKYLLKQQIIAAQSLSLKKALDLESCKHPDANLDEVREKYERSLVDYRNTCTKLNDIYINKELRVDTDDYQAVCESLALATLQGYVHSDDRELSALKLITSLLQSRNKFAQSSTWVAPPVSLHTFSHFRRLRNKLSPNLGSKEYEPVFKEYPGFLDKLESDVYNNQEFADLRSSDSAWVEGTIYNPDTWELTLSKLQKIGWRY